MAIHDCCLVKLQPICLRTCYHSIRHATWPIENRREKLLEQCPSIRHSNQNCETFSGNTVVTLSMQHTCLLIRVESYLAMSLQLQQIYLLAKCNCHTSTAAVPTCLLVECCGKMYACWTVATQSACLPIFCHLILHARWCGASLSAIPAGVLPHYQPSLHV